MEACLFNIQKFSLHDGPGIRTTVFFKGCPLSCFWCSNPESIAFGPQTLWNRDRCTGCGACARACPHGAISPGGGIARDRCRKCAACARICPNGALTISGKMYSLDDVVRECLADRDFYEESGGGVTLSGGEVTSQADFALAVLERLRGENIHTALETNGCAPAGTFERVAEAADLLLFDVKHYDAAKHRDGTGVDNRQILANLAAMLAAGREVLVRIPVIPGFNDTQDDARAFARLLRDMGIARAQVLPFHQFGQNKYGALGMAYPLAGAAQLHPEDLEPYAAVLRNSGVEVLL
ncbi:MAG: glycyl-radical enzyme activating protein [Planctomycetaceae bacterium]|nr:glycyl-radical enzyme activating protein [Planctomycetaceae bacterium]